MVDVPVRQDDRRGVDLVCGVHGARVVRLEKGIQNDRRLPVGKLEA
jgi:hypothetical protein